MNNVYADQNDYFINVKEVNEHIEGFKIIDARSYGAYLKGHLSGAINVTWQSLSDVTGKPGREQWGTLLPDSELEVKLRKLGLHQNDKVVVYADPVSGFGEDGRLAWSLKTAGLSNVRILDGGYPFWKKNHYKTSFLPVTHPSESDFSIGKRDNSMTIGTLPLLEQFDELVIIDSRLKEEFDGKKDYGEARLGHIPHAVHIPFRQLLDSQGRLKPVSEIKSIMESYGIKENSAIVPYCTCGIRSAHMVMALKASGYTHVMNYAPSFYRWAALPYTKID